MPTLTLKFKDREIQTYTLETGGSLTIGRKENNDVSIENLAVSGSHAKVDSVGDGFLLTDLQSKNGTFVNEQRVSSHYLKNNDVVIIGKHTLAFAYAEGEKRPDDKPVVAGGMDQTMVMDTTKQRELLSKTVPDMDSRPGLTQGTSNGMLTYLAGGEGEIELSKKLTKIGKDSNCDIVVSGMMVGKTAATISKRPQGYHLSYVGGMAKPKVNDTTVKESIELKEFDILEVGSVKMQFIYK
jgi:pSer/pThr/pTyr-binding forkhead associated (FHA) protein